MENLLQIVTEAGALMGALLLLIHRITDPRFIRSLASLVRSLKSQR